MFQTEMGTDFSVAAAGSSSPTATTSAPTSTVDCGSPPETTTVEAEETGDCGSPPPDETKAATTTATWTSAATATSTSSSSNSASVCKSAGSLGGIAPPPVTDDPTSARPFSVDGSTFLNLAAACGRACDVQHKYLCPFLCFLIVVCARMRRMRVDRLLPSGIAIPRIRLVKLPILKDFFVSRLVNSSIEIYRSAPEETRF